MEEERYWVFDWLDANGIRDSRDIEAAVSRPDLVDSLFTAAKSLPQDKTKRGLDGNYLVAGRGIDLSGRLGCYHYDCLSDQIDKLFRKAWHYFDRIVIDDTLTTYFQYASELHPDSTDWLKGQLEVLLRIRELGAESLLVFKAKGRPCQDHFREHAEDANLHEALAAADELAIEIASEATVSISTTEAGTLEYSLDHPSLEHTNWGDFDEGVFPDNAEEAKLLAAHQVLRQYMAHLTTDVQFSRVLNQPLGAAIWAHTEILSRARVVPTVADVAMNLNLPVIDGVPLETLLKIRSDETDSFERFRTSLRKAVAEKIRVEDPGEAKRIAGEIKQDLVEPELTRIRSRLKAAEASLKKKAAFGGGVSFLATTCGLLAGVNPPVAALAGLTTLAATQATALSKYLDTKEEVSMSDMYFLWKATDHHSH